MVIALRTRWHGHWRELERQPVPSKAGADKVLNGLDVICSRTEALLAKESPAKIDIA